MTALESFHSPFDREEDLEAYYLPAGLREKIPGWLTLTPRPGGPSLRVPQVTPAFLDEIARYLQRSIRTHLATRSLEERLAALDRIARRWLNPRSPWRERAEPWLEEVTGFSRPVIAEGLEAMAKGLLRDELKAMLQRELGDPEVLTGFRELQPGRLTRAWAPELIFLVLAGNLPAASPPSLVYALLAGSACLAKVSHADPVTASLFARSVAAEEPALGTCLAVLWWNGADRALEDAAFSKSDAVVLYGKHETVRSIARRVPEGRPVLRYGHRIGFGVACREWCGPQNGPELARAFARDVCLFDQQGCVSPQMLFVEAGGEWDAERFAEEMASALAETAGSLPRSRPSTETSLALMQFRAAAEFRGYAGSGARIWASPDGTDWTVLYEPNQSLEPSPLHRTIRVTGVEDIKELPERLQKYRHFLQTAVYGCPEGRTLALAEIIGRLGVSRLAPAGSSQAVAAGWYHDGRPNLLDLLRWTDVEV